MRFKFAIYLLFVVTMLTGCPKEPVSAKKSVTSKKSVEFTLRETLIEVTGMT